MTSDPGGFDIAPFALPNTPPGELRFEEPRDVREVEVAFAAPPPLDLSLSYLEKTWPEVRWELSRDRDDPFLFGWSRRDDQFNCSWRKARAIRRRSGRTVTFTFAGLVREIGRQAAGYDVTFRRTLGLRLDAGRLPPIRSLAVRTVSAPAATRLRVELDAGRRTRGRAVRLSGYNASVRPALVPLRRRSFEIAVAHMAPAHRYSGDAGHVKFDLGHDAFTISLEDLERRGPVWCEHEGVYVARAADPADFAAYRRAQAGRTTTLERIERGEETSLASALRGQPRPHPDAYGLGLKHARQKFWIEPNGDLVLHRHSVARIPGRDTPRFRNRGNGRMFFGLENWIPAGRFTDPAPVPACNLHFKRDAILLGLKAFCVPLRGALAGGEGRPDDPAVALLRFRFRNTSGEPATAGFTVRYSQDSGRSYNCYAGSARQDDRLVPRSPMDRLAARGRDITSPFEGRPALRCRFGPGAAARRDGDGIRLERRLKAGEEFDLVLKVPYVEPEGPAGRAALGRLDFRRGHRAVARFWRDENALGSRIGTPDADLNAVYASHLTHVLMSDYAMPDDPELVNTSVGFSTYGNYSNESCMIVQELDQRGLAEECRRRLEVWVKYQGTAEQPGNFTDYEGMYFGAGGFEDGAYNQHHGWVLWCLAEHYFLTRDRDWFRRVAPSLIRGADWVFRQRRNTFPSLPHSRGWERGFLPAGSLEDVTDFNYWLSTNALTWRGADHAAAALAAIGHPEAPRVRAEADAFRRDLVRGFEEMRKAAPLARLNDGRWVPRYPSRLYARERDYGWIREVLEGAIYLLISGLYDPKGKEAGWIVNDYLDNLYHVPPYGYPMIAPERNLRCRGGFSMQPNLLAGLLPHLDRDEVRTYRWMFFNAFASCYREEIGGLIEHPSPELGFSNSATLKTSDEANSVMWLRYLLVHWNRNELRIGRAVPPSWLEPGRGASITNVATYFGPVSVRYAAGKKKVRLTIELGSPAGAPRITARIPGPLAAVRVNGRRWSRVNRRTGDVDLTGLAGRVVVDAGR